MIAEITQNARIKLKKVHIAAYIGSWQSKWYIQNIPVRHYKPGRKMLF